MGFLWFPNLLCTQVDPMFQRMASSFDESSTAGVFLSVLFSESSRCELLFPSYMTLLQSRPSDSPPPPQKVPASPFLCKHELRCNVVPSPLDADLNVWLRLICCSLCCFCQPDCSVPRRNAPSAPPCRTSPSPAGTLSRSAVSAKVGSPECC